MTRVLGCWPLAHWLLAHWLLAHCDPSRSSWTPDPSQADSLVPAVGVPIRLDFLRPSGLARSTAEHLFEATRSFALGVARVFDRRIAQRVFRSSRLLTVGPLAIGARIAAFVLERSRFVAVIPQEHFATQARSSARAVRLHPVRVPVDLLAIALSAPEAPSSLVRL